MYHPKFPLIPGCIYKCSVTVSNKLSDEILNVMPIEVEPGIFYESGKLPSPNKGFSWNTME